MLEKSAETHQERTTVTTVHWDLTTRLAVSMPYVVETSMTLKDGHYHPHFAGKETECQRSHAIYASHTTGKCWSKVLASSMFCKGFHGRSKAVVLNWEQFCIPSPMGTFDNV